MVIPSTVSDNLVHRVSVVHQVHQVQMVKWVPKVYLVHLVPLELTALKVPPVLRVNLA